MIGYYVYVSDMNVSIFSVIAYVGTWRPHRPIGASASTARSGLYFTGGGIAPTQ